MDRLMMAMFLGGVVLAATPVLLGIGVGIYVLQLHRARKRESGAGEVE